MTCRLQFSLPILTQPLLPITLYLPEYGINPKSLCLVNPTALSPVCTKFQQHNCYLVNLTRVLGFGVGSSESDIKMNQALPSHASLFVKYRRSSNLTATNTQTEILTASWPRPRHVKKFLVITYNVSNLAQWDLPVQKVTLRHVPRNVIQAIKFTFL